MFCAREGEPVAWQVTTYFGEQSARRHVEMPGHHPRGNEENMRLHRLKFTGAILERGFWLYAWRVFSGEREFFYVGRTGDSSSKFAASPFSRLSQHLDIRSKASANMLLRHVRRLKLDPLACEFELLALDQSSANSLPWSSIANIAIVLLD